MLTLFTTPRPFKGHFNIIQRNAIQSWTMLEPRPEIIILDNVEGALEIASEFGLRHIPVVERNRYGTPLVSSLFELAQTHARYSLVCYLNADIILLSDFIHTGQEIMRLMQGSSFLLIGRRQNVCLETLWDFAKEDWEERIKAYALKNGYPESAAATDYFVFPKDIAWNIPPFGIGRGAWDGWFLYNACAMKIPVIDATSLITVLHQQHDYSNWTENYAKNPEFKTNQKLRGGFPHQFTVWDATHLLTSKGLRRPPKIRRFLAHWLRLRMVATDYLKALHPYSYPVVFALKGIRNILKGVRVIAQRIFSNKATNADETTKL